MAQLQLLDLRIQTPHATANATVEAERPGLDKRIVKLQTAKYFLRRQVVKRF